VSTLGNLVILVITGALWHNESEFLIHMPQKNRKNENVDERYKAQEDSPQMPQKVWDILFKNKSGVWTAIFTGLLTVFTFLLYRVSERSNETARTSERAFRSSERAFLSFNGPRVDSRENTPDGRWTRQEFLLDWTNSGNTPAKAVVIQTGGQPFLGDLPTGFEFPLASPKTATVVGPKAHYATSVHISREMLEQSWKGQGVRLFIWGSVLYKDIFPTDPERLTDFCIELTHLALGVPSSAPPESRRPDQISAAPASFDNPNATLTGYQWQACKEHNCYDEDCKDYADRVRDLRPE
jgi:hypothetical protein